MTSFLSTTTTESVTPPIISSTVVVVGGGIGGLAAAFALRTKGCDVTVLERATEFGEVGAGLQIGPNAARILQSWGLLDELLTHGVKPDNLVLNDAVSGQELTRQDLGEDFRKRYGATYLVVHRSDLHRILLEACERVGVVLHTEHLVDEVISSNDTATIGCTNGSTFHSDIVIAADGLNSRLRQRIVGDAIVPSGYVAYRGTFPISEVPDASELNDVIAWLGPKCHFVQYPLRQGEMLNQVAVFRSPSFDTGNPEWGGPEELDEAFAGCSDAVKRVLPYLWRDRHWQMADRNPTENWIDGRVVLLGDAAHPPLQYLAQGACMAIEDAACLSAEALDFVTTLGPGKGWDQAMESYRSQRAPRTARIQTTARTWGEVWHVEGVARTLRNELMTQRDTDSYAYTDWLYGDQG